MAIYTPDSVYFKKKLRKTALIFCGIELVTVGVATLIYVFLQASAAFDVGWVCSLHLANCIVLPMFYGYGILSRLIT